MIIITESGTAVEAGDLIIERPKIVKITYPKETPGQKVYDSGAPLSHVKAVYSQQSKKGK